jgi:site-specific recombinase XerD
VQAFDAYESERFAVPGAASSDFVLVRLFREPAGVPMPPGAVNDLVTAAVRRARLARQVTPHQLRHAFGGNVAGAGGAVDEIAELMGHRSLGSTKVYLHQLSGIASAGRGTAGQQVIGSPEQRSARSDATLVTWEDLTAIPSDA